MPVLAGQGPKAQEALVRGWRKHEKIIEPYPLPPREGECKDADLVKLSPQSDTIRKFAKRPKACGDDRRAEAWMAPTHQLERIREAW